MNCKDCENYVEVEKEYRNIFGKLKKRPFTEEYCLYGVDIDFELKDEKVVTCNKYKKRLKNDLETN